MPKTNRSLLLYLLLNWITSGIYGWYFIHAVAKEINLTCDDDDRYTNGLIMYLLLNLFTFGIYTFVWYATAANRLNRYYQRNHYFNCRVSAKSWLCWTFFGSLILVGPLIAQYEFIHAVNDVNTLYNSSIHSLKNRG